MWCFDGGLWCACGVVASGRELGVLEGVSGNSIAPDGVLPLVPIIGLLRTDGPVGVKM